MLQDPKHTKCPNDSGQLSKNTALTTLIVARLFLILCTSFYIQWHMMSDLGLHCNL